MPSSVVSKAAKYTEAVGAADDDEEEEEDIEMEVWRCFLRSVRSSIRV